jgi:hypothetical protein
MFYLLVNLYQVWHSLTYNFPASKPKDKGTSQKPSFLAIDLTSNSKQKIFTAEKAEFA